MSLVDPGRNDQTIAYVSFSLKYMINIYIYILLVRTCVVTSVISAKLSDLGVIGQQFDEEFVE